MYEVAAFAVHTCEVGIKVSAVFGLVLHVPLVVGQQFMGTVGELAPALVGTGAQLHEATAELSLGFGVFGVGGKGVGGGTG